MDLAESVIAVEQIDHCLKWWQRILNLEFWRVDWEIVSRQQMRNKSAMMEVKPTRARGHALIFIREDILQKVTISEFQALIVHELTHLIYDPIAEEHGFQQRFSGDGEREEEYNTRFTRVLEKAVEHTAQLVCKTLPFVPDGWVKD